MKHKIKFNFKGVLILFTVSALFLFYSCSSEEDTIPETEESIETPKILATINLPSNTTITFKTESDGIVFEAIGDSDNFGELESLNDLSLLDRFLTLTDENVEVPKDLIMLEEDQKLKEKALQRGTIENHDINIPVSKSFLNHTKIPYPYLCNDPRNRYETQFPDKIYETFINYDGFVITSSTNKNSGSKKCKRIQFRITNCHYNRELTIRTRYLPPNSNIKNDKSFSIQPRTHKYYSKTYHTRLQRYIVIASQQGRRFGGDVCFSKFKAGGDLWGR